MGLQRSIFDGTEPLRADKPIRLIELFAGIGAQAKALENLKIPFEHYKICEFDKYAVASYNAVHKTNFEVSDITKIHAEDLCIVDTDKYFYIMTYSFPCTDLSKAGKQQGMSRDSGTRSGLLWEVERLLMEIVRGGGQLPQLLLMENVPDVISDKNKADFFDWCDFLENLGYTSKYDILNAKDFGVPQNRERCFMLSWIGDFYYDFPLPKPLTIKLKDVLEKQVDEKYYLSDQIINCFIKHTQECKEKGNGFRFATTDGDCCGKAITTKAGGRMVDNFIKEPKLEQVAQLEGTFESTGRVYGTDGLSPTINTCGGGQREPKIAEPIICASRGRNPDNQSDRMAEEKFEQRLEFGGHISNALTTVQKDNYVAEPLKVREATAKGYAEAYEDDSVSLEQPNSQTRRGEVNNNYRIRKLTPKECWRLMGFDDEAFERASKKVSNSQLYKQAGNSIVVDVLMAILKPIIGEK